MMHSGAVGCCQSNFKVSKLLKEYKRSEQMLTFRSEQLAELNGDFRPLSEAPSPRDSIMAGPLLEFETEMFLSLFGCDGLLVVAEGMG
ncbi:hypothetical protein INR49_003863 [Caranx melampygus]|nr:hypothetical protein INR49_003863 [Caranx melampygus]